MKKQKTTIKACCISQKIYEPKEWFPLTIDFVQHTHDQEHGQGEFNKQYQISHGYCSQWERCQEVQKLIYEHQPRKNTKIIPCHEKEATP